MNPRRLTLKPSRLETGLNPLVHVFDKINKISSIQVEQGFFLTRLTIDRYQLWHDQQLIHMNITYTAVKVKTLS